MKDARDPWGQRPPPASSSGRLYLWLALILGLLGLVAFLAWRFPDAVHSDGDWSRIVYLSLLLLLVSGSVVLGRRMPLRDTLKQALAWLGVALVLMVGYSYRFELGAIGNRVLGELLPHSGVEAGDRSLSFRAGDDGHFRIEARVDGTAIRFLVDTGATSVVLSPGDAERLGLDLNGLSFSRVVQTANGRVRAAPIRLKEIAVGELRVRDLPALVNEAEMGGSLLGMNFLRRLESYEVRDNAFIIRW